MNGYLLAMEVVERLPDDQKMSCIAALQQAERGQAKLASADWRGALSLCRRAESAFVGIPDAMPLLGVVQADIAAALGNLGRTQEAKSVAVDALPLVEKESMFRRTLGSLHMTIGLID